MLTKNFVTKKETKELTIQIILHYPGHNSYNAKRIELKFRGYFFIISRYALLPPLKHFCKILVKG